MDTDLQFDQVQRNGAASCTACQSALQGSYFQANGQVVCRNCAEAVRGMFSASEGGFVRFLKASGLGTVFGLGGAAVYTAVLVIANINAALITILIGWLVGKGVSRGCGGRGGTGYQILAVLITYGMIGFSTAVSEIMTSDVAEGSLIKGIFICVFGIIAGGVLVSFSSILGAVITFFGLLQAWTSNKAVVIDVTGPHALTPAAPSEDSAQDAPPPLPGQPPALSQGA